MMFRLKKKTGNSKSFNNKRDKRMSVEDNKVLKYLGLNSFILLSPSVPIAIGMPFMAVSYTHLTLPTILLV